MSGFEANQMPAAMMGIEQRKAMKFRTAVMLLESPMVISKLRDEVLVCESCVPLYMGNLFVFLIFFCPVVTGVVFF